MNRGESSYSSSTLEAVAIWQDIEPNSIFGGMQSNITLQWSTAPKALTLNVPNLSVFVQDTVTGLELAVYKNEMH